MVEFSGDGFCQVAEFSGTNNRKDEMKKCQRFTRVTTSVKHKESPDSINISSKSVTICKAKSNKPRQPKTQTLPIPVSNPASFFDNSRLLPFDFFQIDALDLAPRLLGKFLRRDDVVLQITECISHGGHAYVYLCYGLHTMLNVVADKEGIGAAVLIRSCAPITGLDKIQQRRGQKTEKPVLLTGPGKIGQALGISTEWSSHPLYSPGGLELLDGPEPESILVGPRVGNEYVLPEHVGALWRFAIAGTPWISAPKNTLMSP